MTALVCLTNRRDLYVHGAIESARRHLHGWDGLIIVDDSGDAEWRRELAARYHVGGGPSMACMVIGVSAEPAGYTTAMRAVWQTGRALGERIFFLEEDFLIIRDVDLDELNGIMDGRPNLAQLALQRRPWFPAEKMAGSVITPQRVRMDRERKRRGLRPTQWASDGTVIAHDAGFTGNPSLISADALAVDWPECEWSEDAMGSVLLANDLHFAWLGKLADEPHCEHVGSERAEHSTGY